MESLDLRILKFGTYTLQGQEMGDDERCNSRGPQHFLLRSRGAERQAAGEQGLGDGLKLAKVRAK